MTKNETYYVVIVTSSNGIGHVVFLTTNRNKARDESKRISQKYHRYFGTSVVSFSLRDVDKVNTSKIDKIAENDEDYNDYIKDNDGDDII